MSEAGTSGYWSLLRRNRDFRLLYGATLISLAGDWFLTVALLDLVLDIANSASLASMIVVCQTLPAFFATPHAGHLIDKVDRRKLMIVVDIIRSGAALLPLLTHDAPTLVFAYAGVIVISLGVTYFDPAAQAALPNMVEERDLAPANVLIGSTWGTMLAVGAALGGLVVMQFGRDVAFVVDAASFLLSALMISRITAPFSEQRSEQHAHPPFGQAMRETLAYARENRRVLGLLTSKGGFGIGGGVVAMLSVFGREVFAAGASGIGLLYAARGLGALLGPFLVRWTSSSDDDQYRKIAYCGAVFGIGYMGLALTNHLWLGAALVGMAHVGGGAQWVTSSYGLQREVPDAIRGRVFAVDYGLVTLTMSVSAVVAGSLADRYGPTFGTVSVASLCVLWSFVWGAWTWKLWRETGLPGAGGESQRPNVEC